LLSALNPASTARVSIKLPVNRTVVLQSARFVNYMMLNNCSEEVILNEERTTDEEKMKIIEGIALDSTGGLNGGDI